MKNTIALLCLLLLASCYTTEHNCKDFKTGKFKFEYEVDGVKKTTVFERNDSIEVETFEGKTDTASIRWVNDCEYILQKLHPKNMVEEKAIVMKILTTSLKTGLIVVWSCMALTGDTFWYLSYAKLEWWCC